MKFNYSVEVDTNTGFVQIHGNSSNNNVFSLHAEINNGGYVKYYGSSPLDHYNDKVFTGGEWQYFERQKESFKYILGDTHSSNYSYKDDPNNKRKPRNGYRPVTVKEPLNKEVKGYLICFNQEGNLQDGITLFAAVELEDGKVYQYDAYDVKFDDV